MGWGWGFMLSTPKKQAGVVRVLANSNPHAQKPSHLALRAIPAPRGGHHHQVVEGAWRWLARRGRGHAGRGRSGGAGGGGGDCGDLPRRPAGHGVEGVSLGAEARQVSSTCARTHLLGGLVCDWGEHGDAKSGKADGLRIASALEGKQRAFKKRMQQGALRRTRSANSSRAEGGAPAKMTARAGNRPLNSRLVPSVAAMMMKGPRRPPPPAARWAGPG